MIFMFRVYLSICIYIYIYIICIVRYILLVVSKTKSNLLSTRFRVSHVMGQQRGTLQQVMQASVCSPAFRLLAIFRDYFQWDRDIIWLPFIWAAFPNFLSSTSIDTAYQDFF